MTEPMYTTAQSITGCDFSLDMFYQWVKQHGLSSVIRFLGMMFCLLGKINDIYLYIYLSIFRVYSFVFTILDSSNMQSFELQEGPQRGGLTTVTAIFFVVGNILGAGLVAIPYAAKLASWLNFPLLILIPVTCGICGVFLAKSVSIAVTGGNNSQSETSREPYPQLAREAVGDKCRSFVVVVLYCAQVSACLVFLLLSGEILSKLIPIGFANMSSHNVLRIWVSISVVVLMPFNLLGSPKDFWGIALAASTTSMITSTLMLVCLGIINYNDTVHVHPPKVLAENVFASFGIIVFAFSGVGIFPTVQSDMKQPEKFSTVVIIGFGVLSIVYVSVAEVSYFVLGDKIGEDILTTFASFDIYHTIVPYRVFVTISQVLILGHVFSAFVLQINPVYLLAELSLNAPNSKLIIHYCIELLRFEVLILIKLR